MPSELLPAGPPLAGRYRLDDVLGRGAMGVVYRAHDLTLERDVAVKLVRAELLGMEGRARLLQEARAAARLNHPNIVAVHDAGEADGSPFIVMELVKGHSLRDEMNLASKDVIQVVLEICAALDHAHAHDIVHRDVKPENILIVDEAGRRTAKLTDFGVAHVERGTRATADGAIVGTALYMAPEQATGDQVDARSDLYSLGAVIYELLTGRAPFPGDDALVVIAEHLYAPVVPPRTHRPEISPALEALILKLLAKRPEDRPASAREVAAELEAAARGPEVTAAVEPPPEDAAATVNLLAQLARGRLIGRRGELANLRALWNAAAKGNGRLALISGEPGVGKTRLAREVMVYAQLSGALVLSGGCYEFEAATPYLPFVEALRTWVQHTDPGRLKDALGSTAPELARLAPEIAARVGPLPPTPALSPNEERLRLFDNVARFLKARAAERGVLIFLDDLHWADQGTLSLLYYLLRQAKQDRILFLGAYREVELDRAHPLAAALVEWNREGLSTRVALDRLSEPETGALLATLFGQASVSPDFAAAMFRETEGNPFFIEEVVKSLIEQGQIYREAGEWQRRDVADLAIPQSVKEAIGRRLNRLSPACLEVLHTAAALGKVFDFEALAAAAPQGEDEVLDALDEACAVQLLRVERQDRFSFTHDKVREVLYSEQNPVRRRRLHLKIGQALETLHAADLEPHVQDLAHHFIHGGNLQKGLEYSLQAAAAARKVFAADAALASYEDARECAEAVNLPERLVSIYEEISAVYLDTGQALKCVENLEKALDRCADPAHRAEIKARIGQAYAHVGDERGLEPLNEALAELDPETQPSGVAMATTTLGRYHHYRMQHARAVAEFEKARGIAESLNDVSLLTHVYAYLAGAEQHRARWKESVAWAWKCVELGERTGSPSTSGIGHEFLGETYSQPGYWQKALEHSARDREIGKQIGGRDRIAWSYFATGLSNSLAGRLQAALDAFDTSLSVAAEIGEGRLEMMVRATRAFVETDLGLDDRARAGIDTVFRLADETDHPFAHHSARWAAAYFHLQRREFTEALQYAREDVERLAGSDNNLARYRIYPILVESLLETGQPGEARLANDRLRALALEVESPLLTASAAGLTGRIAHRSGNPEEASREFDRSIETLRSLDLRLLLARTLVARAALRRDCGDAAGAEADRTEAAALFRECGAARDLEQLEASGA